jgi:broad specificity phosphatase PhoE
MSTLLLVRHGLTAKTGPVLTGRSPGVHLDERGEKQAAAVAERIAALPRRASASPSRPPDATRTGTWTSG